MIDSSLDRAYYAGMIGEHLFGYDSFDIDPFSDGAKDRLYEAVSAKRREMKNTPEARRKHILVGNIWSRGYNLYFEVYPTREGEDQEAPTLALPLTS